jgi:hypothetical protein
MYTLKQKQKAKRELLTQSEPLVSTCTSKEKLLVYSCQLLNQDVAVSSTALFVVY